MAEALDDWEQLAAARDSGNGSLAGLCSSNVTTGSRPARPSAEDPGLAAAQGRVPEGRPGREMHDIRAAAERGDAAPSIVVGRWKSR
jgi:hypothetical protein